MVIMPDDRVVLKQTNDYFVGPPPEVGEYWPTSAQVILEAGTRGTVIKIGGGEDDENLIDVYWDSGEYTALIDEEEVTLLHPLLLLAEAIHD